MKKLMQFIVCAERPDVPWTRQETQLLVQIATIIISIGSIIINLTVIF